MDLSLIAVWTPDWAWWGYLAQGILALGLVILIHEFGHFAAAKLCGVRVEKFYIGFDFFGLRLFRFRWGETEYGIGAFPLGGYVSMFGQTDNPAKQAEEAERAKALKAGTAAEGLVTGTTVESEELSPGLIVDGQWHPRSYPAQTVPERMFIISAGVMMNAITAFCFGVGAYLMGVDYTPTIVGGVSPGLPAWEADLRIGDDITQIDDIKDPRFEADLRTRAVLVDMSKGLDFHVSRPGDGQFERNICPRQLRKDMYPTLGVAVEHLTRLMKVPEGKWPTDPGTPAREAEPKFASGDQFIRYGDREIKTYEDLVKAQTALADQKVKIVVSRAKAGTASDSTATDEAREELTIEVAPRPMRMLGMAMELGPISSIQENSPAALPDGLRVGDRLMTIDDKPIGDPATLAERLRRKQKEAPGKPWVIAVQRGSREGLPPLNVTITPREADRYEPTLFPGAPFSVPVLGIALPLNPKVAAVEPDGPAAKAGVKVGDVFTSLKTIPGEPAEGSEKGNVADKSSTVKLTDLDEHNWPSIQASIQLLAKSTKLELTTKDDKKLTLEPADSTEFFQADRGFNFENPRKVRKAADLSEACRFAWQDTRDAMTQVYKFLNRMWIGQIPASNVGGMITIAQQASASASVGFSQLLLFMLMLSCNLAVLNFLPIPVLDGGHIVFLVYEGIFRRPPPMKLFNILQLIGLVLLIGLMVFALTNDVIRLTK